jgi:nicotinamidase-related amidase
VVYGVVTEICVSAAVTGLLDRGYSVTVVEDAIRHLDPQKAQAFLDDLGKRGGRVAASNSLLKPSVAA